MMFEVRCGKLGGYKEIIPVKLRDIRGEFVKTFHAEQFRQIGIVDSFSEEYYSISRRGVLRGLHFQRPPMEHAKLVYCVEGSVLDVAVDLRKSSATYGQSETVELNSEKANMVYVPVGFAHGFYTLSSRAVIICKATSVFSEECDAGIRWDSVGIVWPNGEPILSDKDMAQPIWSVFISPFV